MFDLGTQELIVIFIVAFLVFGPKKLPELGRTLGKGIRELKAAMRGVKDTFEEAGSDVTEELKGAKSELEDSIYKTVEPHINEKGDRKEEKIDAPDQHSKSVTSGEEGKKEETDKDG
jgi:TatA/E family protein of Tat protein translocase